jgi:spore germination protein
MVIHTIQPNETVYTVAEKYGVSVNTLIRDNQIINPDRPVIGESLAIMTPRETYVIQEGDDLQSIADSFGVTVMHLLRNNPHLFDEMYLIHGDEIVIHFADEKKGEISVNGYAFPFIDPRILQKTLPYLTYLTIFYYKIMSDGSIREINDLNLIQLAKAYGVAPLMSISTLSDSGDADMVATTNILAVPEYQERLIIQVMDTLRNKGYYGLNIDMQNIPLEEIQLFVDFVANLSGRLKQEGYYLNISLSPRTFPTSTGFLYLGPEYEILGQLSDSVILLSYEWGHAHSPQPALSLEAARGFLNYAVTQIPANKINIGFPTIGYVWQLPFIPGRTVAHAITQNSALALANDVGAVVNRDPASEAPFFTYALDVEYVVWFRDVRSTAALLGLVEEYDLQGIGIWNTMQFASGIWLMINSQYDILKVL